MTSYKAGASALPERVIVPHSGHEAFLEALRSMWLEFPHARMLAWRFFLRDTRADFRQSVLGYVWLVFTPLANTLVWVFLNAQNIVRIDAGSVPYPLFVLSGTILWTALNASLISILNVVNSARGMLGKVNFPHEALIYAALLKATADGVIASVMLAPILLSLGASWQVTMLLFPLALLGSLILGAAIALLLLPLAALYSDVGRMAQLAMRFGFFLTPVIFQLPSAGIARKLMLLNPATPIIVTGRAWLTGSADAMPVYFASVISGSLVLLVLGLIIYKVTLPHLIERLSG